MLVCDQPLRFFVFNDGSIACFPSGYVVTNTGRVYVAAPFTSSYKPGDSPWASLRFATARQLFADKRCKEIYNRQEWRESLMKLVATSPVGDRTVVDDSTIAQMF